MGKNSPSSELNISPMPPLPHHGLTSPFAECCTWCFPNPWCRRLGTLCYTSSLMLLCSSYWFSSALPVHHLWLQSLSSCVPAPVRVAQGHGPLEVGKNSYLISNTRHHCLPRCVFLFSIDKFFINKIIKPPKHCRDNYSS